MPPKTGVDRIVLTWPTHLASPTIDGVGGAPTSWNQVAKTGSFVSTRYGKFSITKADLAKMLHNFVNVTPKPPTQLPVDYDHLSMDPKKPGDGMAAGWIQKLELREGGDELWAQVKWTPDAASKIGNKEYQFVSPSFVKDYVYKDGTAIGTTLLAAAITNHPFLEGMAALTLSGGLKELATLVPETLMLMEVGQRVMVKQGMEHDGSEAGLTLEIAEVVGEGDDAFVSLKDEGGAVHKWFRATELGPAMLATPAANGEEDDPEKAKVEGEIDPVTGKPKVVAKPAFGAKKPAAPGDPNAAKPAAGGLAPGVNTGDPNAHAAAASAHAHAASAHAFISSPLAAKGFSMSTTFKLSHDGKDIEVTAEQLAKAGITIVPEGSVVMEKTAVEELQGKVTNLSEQVTTLAEVAATSQKQNRLVLMNATLDKLSKGGFIDKKTRDWAVKTYGESTDLTSFNEWAALQTRRVIELETEHGSGAGGEAPAPAEQLMTLANTIAKEKRISLRDALIQASAELPEAAEAYREGFATEVVQ